MDRHMMNAVAVLVVWLSGVAEASFVWGGTCTAGRKVLEVTIGPNQGYPGYNRTTIGDIPAGLGSVVINIESDGGDVGFEVRDKLDGTVVVVSGLVDLFAGALGDGPAVYRNTTYLYSGYNNASGSERFEILGDSTRVLVVAAVTNADPPVNASVTYSWSARCFREIRTRQQFDAVATTGSVPGALFAPVMRFVAMGIDSGSPELYFVNSGTYSDHYAFVREVLGTYSSKAAFDADTFFSDSRKNIAGTVVAHDWYMSEGLQGLYTMEFWPTDRVPNALTIATYNLIRQHFPAADGRLAYHLVSTAHQAVYSGHEDTFEFADVPVIAPDRLFSRVTFTPLHLGEGYGVLRVVGEGCPEEPITARDVVVLKAAAQTSDLPRVGGIITDAQQTRLSRLDAKARRNNVPNAFIKDASSDPAIRSLLGKPVHYRVWAGGYELRESTHQAAKIWRESTRPKKRQVPQPIPHPQIGFIRRFGRGNYTTERSIFGTSAASLGQVAKLQSRGDTIEGQVVALKLYDDHMSAKRCNSDGADEWLRLCASPTDPAGKSFYDQALEMMAMSIFKRSAAVRHAMLQDFRRKIELGETSPATTIRLETITHYFYEYLRRRNSDRSKFPLLLQPSTNDEELEGFGGAGVYKSVRYDPSTGHIENAVKKVWAGLWAFNAFEERSFCRIDHFEARMGMYVQEIYDDQWANGGAVTKNFYAQGTTGHYINAQYFGMSIDSRKPIVGNTDTFYSVPDEYVLAEFRNSAAGDSVGKVRQNIRYSNVWEVNGTRVGYGEVLERSEIHDLWYRLSKLQRQLKEVFGGGDDFAVEVKFRVGRAADGNRGKIEFVQALPWSL